VFRTAWGVSVGDHVVCLVVSVDVSVRVRRRLSVCLPQEPQYLARELRRLRRRQIVLKPLTQSVVSCPERR